MRVLSLQLSTKWLVEHRLITGGVSSDRSSLSIERAKVVSEFVPCSVVRFALGVDAKRNKLPIPRSRVRYLGECYIVFCPTDRSQYADRT